MIKRIFFTLFLLLFIFNTNFAQENIAENNLTKNDLTEDNLKDKGLVKVIDVVPYISEYIVYATPYNFMGKVLYKNLNHAWLRPEAAEKLKKAAEYLRTKRLDLHIVVYDAARPISIQKEMWNLVEGTDMEDFVANPNKKGGGMHNYGMAVDVTLADCTGHPIGMGSEYDYFGDRARVDKEDILLKNNEITKRELENRLLLREIMTYAGFIVEPSEWWHFNAMPAKQVRKKFKAIE